MMGQFILGCIVEYGLSGGRGKGGDGVKCVAGGGRLGGVRIRGEMEWRSRFVITNKKNK